MDDPEEPIELEETYNSELIETLKALSDPHPLSAVDDIMTAQYGDGPNEFVREGIKHARDEITRWLEENSGPTMPSEKRPKVTRASVILDGYLAPTKPDQTSDERLREAIGLLQEAIDDAE